MIREIGMTAGRFGGLFEEIIVTGGTDAGRYDPRQFVVQAPAMRHNRLRNLRISTTPPISFTAARLLSARVIWGFARKRFSSSLVQPRIITRLVPRW